MTAPRPGSCDDGYLTTPADSQPPLETADRPTYTLDCEEPVHLLMSLPAFRTLIDNQSSSGSTTYSVAVYTPSIVVKR